MTTLYLDYTYSYVYHKRMIYDISVQKTKPKSKKSDDGSVAHTLYCLLKPVAVPGAGTVLKCRHTDMYVYMSSFEGAALGLLG